jgi:LPXTG-motif cell wall-anchored protein
LSDAFKLGKYYFIMLAFEAEDGYYISPETELYINGEKADNDPTMSMLLKAMVHSFGELTEDSGNQDDDQTGVPETSDNASLIIFAAVIAMVAAAGMLFIRRKEEK